MSFRNPARSTRSASFLPLPTFYGSGAFRYDEAPMAPRLTRRTIEVKHSRVVEFTESRESAFGPSSKRTWRSEAEASIEETYE